MAKTLWFEFAVASTIVMPKRQNGDKELENLPLFFCLLPAAQNINPRRIR